MIEATPESVMVVKFALLSLAYPLARVAEKDTRVEQVECKGSEGDHGTIKDVCNKHSAG